MNYFQGRVAQICSDYWNREGAAALQAGILVLYPITADTSHQMITYEAYIKVCSSTLCEEWMIALIITF